LEGGCVRWQPKKESLEYAQKSEEWYGYNEKLQDQIKIQEPRRFIGIAGKDAKGRGTTLWSGRRLRKSEWTNM